MELNKLYNIAENENINIINFKMKSKAIIGCIHDNYCIGLNYSKIDSSCEEKTILAEELGHYYTNSLYDSNCSLETINKKEFRANKWAFKTLVPFNKFKEFCKTDKYSYEIAEEFGVTEDLIQKAYNYYKENELMVKC